MRTFLVPSSSGEGAFNIPPLARFRWGLLGNCLIPKSFLQTWIAYSCMCFFAFLTIVFSPLICSFCEWQHILKRLTNLALGLVQVGQTRFLCCWDGVRLCFSILAKSQLGFELHVTDLSSQIYLWKTCIAPGRHGSGAEHGPRKQEVTDSVPGQGTCWGSRLHPPWWGVQVAADGWIPPSSMFFSLSL